MTGPTYNALGISPNEKVEGLGVPLNQMARVVAYDGDMSESDIKYMASPLPLEKIQGGLCPNVYGPLKVECAIQFRTLDRWFSVALTVDARKKFTRIF